MAPSSESEGEDRLAAESFVAALFRLYKTAHYPTDFTVHCGDRQWSVHRIILAAQSKFFEKLCYSQFKEGQEGKVHLDDDDPDDIDFLITYFYTDHFIPHWHFADTIPIDAIARTYLLADKYDCSGLKRFAFWSLKGKVYNFVGDAEKIEAEAKRLFQELVIAVPHIYSNSPPGDLNLRQLAVYVMCQGAECQLMKFVTKEIWTDLMGKAPESVAEVMKNRFASLEKKLFHRDGVDSG